MTIEIQAWFCEHCGTASSVSLEKGEDVMSVIYKIESDHKQLSPMCPIPVRSLRLGTPAAANDGEGA